MSQKFTQDGVELVVAGLREFENDMKRAGIAWDDTVQRFRKGGKFISDVDVGKAFKSLEGSAASVTPTLGNLASNLDITGVAASGMSTESVALGAAIGVLGGAAVMAAAKIGKELVGAIRDAVGWMKQTATQALMLAGEFQEMELATLAIGRAMGKSRVEIESSVQQMVDLGIRTDVANKTVAQFTRYQLDLASAVDLVRIAQATGIMMHRDSTEEMESLVHAALSGSTIMLRQRNIFIDVAKAAKDYAAVLGRDVDTLNQAELAQGRLNAIIESGANLLDVYSETMKSPTKQLRTLTQREIPELLAQVGEPFLKAFSTAVGGVREVVGALMEATREGGSLYPVLINLGAAASLIADGFAAAAKYIADWIRNFDLSVTKGLTGVIEKMFTFGFELVAFFAEGIVTATVTVLTAAMKAISWVLENWIAPGSPPKIAPGITQWGIDVMAAYLRGFTMADFSILETIQDPLSRILEGPQFAEFSQELIAAMGGGKELGTSFYDRIAEAAGKFGKEVAELTRQRVELVRATDAATAAEKRLEQAEKSALKTQQQVGVERRKYNEMLREGASRAQLAVQMIQVRNAEKQAATAREEVNASQAASEAATERQETAQEQYDLQSKLLNQLLQLDKVQQDIAEGKVPAIPEAPKIKAGEPIIPGLEMPEPGAWDITSRISDAIDRAKAKLKEKLKELFKPLTDAWAEIQRQGALLADESLAFSIRVGLAWDELKKQHPFLQDLETWVKDQPDLLTALGSAWDIASGKIADGWAILKEDYPILQTIEDWILEQIDKLPTLSQVWASFSSTVGGIWERMKEKWDESRLKESIVDWIESQIDRLPILQEEWGKFRDKLISYWNDLREAWDEGRIWEFLIGHSPSPLEKGLRGINRELGRLDTSVFSKMGNMVTALGGMQYRQPRMAMATPMGSTTTQHVTVDIGDVYISDREEGERFQSRVEYAVVSALKMDRI